MKLRQEELIGPLSLPENQTDVHISRFGVIPKRHQSGKWRLILDLSCPQEASDNAGISIYLCSLQYVTVDHAAKIIFVDTVLPFGLPSAQKLFCTISDAEWILGRRGLSSVLYYIDDFVIFGRENSQGCQCNMSILRRTTNTSSDLKN